MSVPWSPGSSGSWQGSSDPHHRLQGVLESLQRMIRSLQVSLKACDLTASCEAKIQDAMRRLAKSCTAIRGRMREVQTMPGGSRAAQFASSAESTLRLWVATAKEIRRICACNEIVGAVGGAGDAGGFGGGDPGNPPLGP